MNRSIFLNWFFTENQKHIKLYNLNFGPQHPATHGVLRLILQLNNELIEYIDIHIGYLHRGTEKLFETKQYLQNLPYFDRFDYTTMFIHEHLFCISYETLLKFINYNSFLLFIRIMFDEISRILNHIIALACHALDIGSMTPIFWIFEEREKLLEFCEKISGSRMHSLLFKYKTTLNLFYQFESILLFCKNFLFSLNEIHNVLTYNKIWKNRLINIGSISLKNCIEYGLTGIILRSSGKKHDLRIKNNNLWNEYFFFNFKTFIGKNGDCYDRFLLRLNELFESIFLIVQILKKLKIKNYFLILQKTNYKFFSMNEIINNYKFYSGSKSIKKNISFLTLESPKGELGLTIISNNTNKPWKMKLKSPGFLHLQFLGFISKNYFLTDLITLIGSIDIVFGEIDK